MESPADKTTHANDLQFTGERFVPHHADPILALEHYHRYCLASRFVKGKKVLDIACGEGYGSAFLAKRAGLVVAVDSDPATIAHARKTYAGYDNLSFMVGRCQELCCRSGVFDVVVGFEMLEHLAENDQPRFVENVRRTLRPGGLFIVSSPEKIEYDATLEVSNEFHEHELTLQELQSFLEGYFEYVHIVAQRVLSVSTVWPLSGWQEAQFRFYARRDLLENVKSGESFSQPLYLIALCSDVPFSEEVISESGSFYFDTANVERMKEILRWAQHMNAELEECNRWAVRQDLQVQQNREVIQQLQRQLEERTAWAQELDDQMHDHKARIDSLQQEFEERTRWALSLESEAAAERKQATRLNEELEEARARGANLETQLIVVTSSFVYRVLARLGLLPKVRAE